MHVCAPVVHAVTPAEHAPGLPVHDCPALHAPLPSQTWPMPQPVPATRFSPSMQLVTTPVQIVVPCLHAVGLPVQLCMARQAPQNPLPSHSCPPVHIVVDDLGVPSMHVDAP